MRGEAESSTATTTMVRACICLEIVKGKLSHLLAEDGSLIRDLDLEMPVPRLRLFLFLVGLLGSRHRYPGEQLREQSENEPRRTLHSAD